MSRASATASLRVASSSHAGSQNPPIRRLGGLGGHQGKKGLERSTIATTRIAFRAILGPLYPTPECLGGGTRILKALAGGILVLVILRAVVSDYDSSIGISSSSGSYPSLSLKGVAHLDPSCRNLTSLPYPPNGLFGHGLFTPHGLHTFIFLSSHRIGPSEIAVIGFTPRALRGLWLPQDSPAGKAAREIDRGGFLHDSEAGCLWVSFEGPHTIKGSMHFILPGSDASTHSSENPHHLYETVIIRCNLESRTPGNPGGTLFMRIHDKDVLVHKERDLRPPAGSFLDASTTRILSPPQPLPRKATVCSYLWDEEIVESHAAEQLQYLSFVGFDSFIAYLDAPLDTHRQSITALSSAVAPGAFSTVSFTGLSRVSVNHRIATSNDCLYRTFFTSQWAISLSFNDYPFAPPPASLASVLASHAGEPWLSFGGSLHHPQLCSYPAEEYQWLQERMMWRSSSPICHRSTSSIPASDGSGEPSGLEMGLRVEDEWFSAANSTAQQEGGEVPGGSLEDDPTLCLGAKGRRRIMVNPRLVLALKEFECASPATGGVDIPTRNLQIHTLMDFCRPGLPLCDMVHKEDTRYQARDHSYQRYDDFSKFIRQGRMAGVLTLRHKYQ